MSEGIKNISELVLGAKSSGSAYSTHFSKNFNVDGSPSDVDLENIFNYPQDNIENIVGYAKYCYRKYGIIMRTVNIIRDFGSTGVTLNYPSKSAQVKKIIEKYNETIDVNQLVRDFIYEIALTGNLACYDRDGKRVDIYPIDMIEPVPLVIDNKQIIAYKNPLSASFNTTTYGKDIDDKIKKAYPKEIQEAITKSKEYAILDSKNAFFAKINASQYEPYGLSILVPAFEDLAHKSLLKEAEKATANDIIDKLMLIKIGDEENKPSKALIDDYTALLDNISGSVRLTVPYYVDAKYVEPETTVFANEKFLEVDKDILNTLGISLSLIRGESGGNYSEGIINFSGLIRTIESIREPISKIIEGLYKNELKRNGLKEEAAPKVRFKEVVIDKEAKLNLMKELFTTAGLPYRVLYEEHDMDFDSIKLIREQENDENIEEVFKLRAQPFQGMIGTGNEGGGQEKTLTERKTDKTSSNNSQPRTGLTKTNRSAD
jgi:hypothetical protein